LAVIKIFSDTIISSNVAGGLLVDMLSYARIEPQVLQIEHHPYLTQQPLLNLAKTLGIAVTAYSSFGYQSYVELGFKGSVKPLFEQDPVVKAAMTHEKRLSFPKCCSTVTGTKAGTDPAQILLRWATQRGIAVIPKTNEQSRLSTNLECASFDLTEAEMQSISGLNLNLRVRSSAGYPNEADR
jgi:D-xylose reductase